MRLDEIIAQKNGVVMSLQEAKARANVPDETVRLASIAAEMEGEIAQRLLVLGRVERAVTNLVSQASCLFDAREVTPAIRVLMVAWTLTNKTGMHKWIDDAIRQRQSEATKPLEPWPPSNRDWASLLNTMKLEVASIDTVVGACAFFAPTAIPISLLAKGANYFTGADATVFAEHNRLDNAINVMVKHGVAERHPEPPSVTILPLALHGLRETIPSAFRQNACRVALHMLNDFIPAPFEGDPADWKPGPLVISHVASLVRHALSLGIKEEPLVRVLMQIGFLFQARQDDDLAKHYYELALPMSLDVSGEAHSDTVTLRNNFTNLLLAAGDVREANATFEPVLKAAYTVFDVYPAKLARVLNTGGFLQTRLRNFGRARKLHDEALEVLRRIEPVDQGELSATLHNIGILTYEQGNFREALAAFEGALQIRTSLYGAQVGDAVASEAGLAMAAQALGDFPRAKQSFERVLKVFEDNTGTDHRLPEILNNLAIGMLDSGIPAALAKHILARALGVANSRFGPRSPSAANIMNTLASAEHALGDDSKTRALYEAALEIALETMKEHPLTLSILNNFGGFLLDTEGTEEAIDVLMRAEEMALRIMPPNHPDLGAILSNLGGGYLEKGDFTQAEAYFVRAAAIATEALGIDHPKTKAAEAVLAHIRRKDQWTPEVKRLVAASRSREGVLALR